MKKFMIKNKYMNIYTEEYKTLDEAIERIKRFEDPENWNIIKFDEDESPSSILGFVNEETIIDGVIFIK